MFLDTHVEVAAPLHPQRIEVGFARLDGRRPLAAQIRELHRRYGGLRCPSEHLALTWRDVDWERGRITIRASKMAHHADGGVRTIPIFPEVRTHLEAVGDQAEPGAENVITRYRSANANLRTQLERIIRRAGLKPGQSSGRT